ncbi:MAG TPA: DASS family sodium-coupled anion symporter [Xanthomonadaceae bacterium]|nr:DASS family sodium-coupled anion symporter [Xanthomonadaceae bacterium]
MQRIGWSGFFAGPLAGLLLYLLLPEAADGGLDTAGRATVAIGTWMAVWWMTEAIPLPVTALLPVVLFPLAGVMPAAMALAPYASEIVFLFMGGFMIGLAMQRWSLHTRIALRIVRIVGTAPRRLVAGFMLATALLSMWISNTAATVMLLPMGISVIELMRRHLDLEDPKVAQTLRSFATCLMLGMAYGASIGGLGTLIGSPPNLILANFARAEMDIDIGMWDWMKVGLPLVAVMLPLTWLYLTRLVFPLRIEVPEAARMEIREDLERLGPMSRAERMLLGVFVATASAWILRPQIVHWTGIEGLTDAVIAMCGAVSLFLLPVDVRQRKFLLDWDTAQRLPWGILLLFGGGLSLAAAISANGVDAWLASGFSGLHGIHILWVMLAASALVVLLTSMFSNTAIATTFIPVLAAATMGLGIAPLPVLFAAAFAATCAFMLPVATPPNAIVFASGHVRIADMVRAGLGLNILAVAVIVLVVKGLGGWLLPAMP